MKNELFEQLMRIPNSSAGFFFDRSIKRLLPADCHRNQSFDIRQRNEISRIRRKIKLGFNVENFSKGILDHGNYISFKKTESPYDFWFFSWNLNFCLVKFAVRLAPKLIETVKGKLRLGARILQVGGVEKVFNKLFTCGHNEKLLKACQCYLSTTAGPIAGLLFISTEKVAFCSERSIKLVSPTGKALRIYYKVSIPLSKIKRANASENAIKPSQKYIEVVTNDNFEFWFMGFLNHQKTLDYLQQLLQ